MSVTQDTNGTQTGVKFDLSLELGKLSSDMKEVHKFMGALKRQSPFSAKDSANKVGASATYTFIALRPPQPGYVYQLRRLNVYNPADPFTSLSSVYALAYLGMPPSTGDGSAEPVFNSMVNPPAAIDFGLSSEFGRGEVTLKSGEQVVVCVKSIGTNTIQVDAEYEVWREDDRPSEIAP